MELAGLEAEDRAALADEIDDSAKNKCNWATATVHLSQACSYTKTDSDLTIASTTSDGWGHVAYSIGTLPAGNYTLSVKVSSYSATSATCKVGVGTTTDALASISGNGTVTLNFTKSSASDTKIYFYANYSATAIVNSYVASEIMICTKAAFGVSSKFVPYRPNWDLVSYLANAGGFVNNTNGGIATNADLNSITTSCFRVYNSPSNLPPNESGYCFCKTYVYDTSSALQELYMHDYPTRTYKRFKINGTWKDWSFTGGSTNILINFNPSAAQTWELAYTITIPGKSMLKASASLLFTNSPVRGILMTTSTTNPTNGDDLQCIDQQDSSIKCMMNISNVYINSNPGSKNIYIFAKQNSAGVTNRLSLSYEISKYKEV